LGKEFLVKKCFKLSGSASSFMVVCALLRPTSTACSLSGEERAARMTRAALSMRVSTVDQHPETQLLDLRQMAAQRGLDIVHQYTDRISGVKAKRPGHDAMTPAAASSMLSWSGPPTGSPGR
jgi:hypothetical protein